MLVDNGVAFIIIGGQAQKLINATHRTRDLDIWVRLSGEDDNPGLSRALIAWIKDHRQHSSINVAKPLELTPNLQIHFPESDGVCFRNEDNEICSIDAADGIDVLTSVGSFEFDEFYARAVDIGFMQVRSLCASDLCRTRRLRQ